MEKEQAQGYHQQYKRGDGKLPPPDSAGAGGKPSTPDYC